MPFLRVLASVGRREGGGVNFFEKAFSALRVISKMYRNPNITHFLLRLL